MDIQKERAAFEKHWIENFDAIDLEDAEYRDDLNMYEHPTLFADDLNKAWSSWQAAKAQAIPEGFVLVPKELGDGAAENLALNQWEVNKTLLSFQYSDLNTFEFEEVRLNYCKNMANKFKVDYKTMIKAAEGE